MYNFGKCLLITILSICLLSCENTEAELLVYEVNSHDAEVFFDYSTNSILVNFPEDVTSAQDLIADFLLSEGADAFVGGEIQESGVSKNSFEEPFSFGVVSEDGHLSTSWMVRPSNNDFTSNWSMGGFMKYNKSLNKDYDWYIDQAKTGTFSPVNCAPSSVVMASRWCDGNFPHSVEDARSMYHPEGGGWYTSDIDNCLTDFSISHSIIELAESIEETTQIIKDQIDHGNLLMICIDIYYLRLAESTSSRADRYYTSIKLGAGHCIVLKGYKLIDGEMFFEFYDPIGYNYKYSNGKLKGKDRYYRGEDIFTATFGTWNYAFTISDSSSKSVEQHSLKVSDIPHILVL